MKITITIQDITDLEVIEAIHESRNKLIEGFQLSELNRNHNQDLYSYSASFKNSYVPINKETLLNILKK